MLNNYQAMACRALCIVFLGQDTVLSQYMYLSQPRVTNSHIDSVTPYPL